MRNQKRETDKINFEKNRIMPELVVRPACLKCNDVHFVTVNGQTVPCECQKEARQKARNAIYYKMCQIPEAREEWTLDKFIARPGCEMMLLAAKQVVAGQLKWLTIISKSGYGKTHIAVGICREFLKQGKSARYIYTPDLISELKTGFDETGLSSYQSKMDFFKNVTLLAIDDLGTEKATPWVREQLDTIIDSRYVNKMPLIVTTNQALEEIMPRIASRLTRVEVEGFGRVVIPRGANYADYVKRGGK